MQKLLKDYLDDFNKKQKKNRRVAVAAVLLVVMVVGSVLNILTQYGVAMTGAPVCGLEEHTHGESCYTSVLSCGQDETEGHTHTEDCLYPEELVCGEEEGEGEEHTHSDGCYAVPDGYACGQEESEGHTHSDGCYTSELTCGLKEHTHTDACYAAKEEAPDVVSNDGNSSDGSISAEGSVDGSGSETADSGSAAEGETEASGDAGEDTAAGTDEIVTEDLNGTAEGITGTETDGTVGTVQEDKKTDGEEVTDGTEAADGTEETEESSGDETEEEGPDPEADVESPEDWDAQYGDVEWQDVWGEDLVTAARLQIGYQESGSNYIVAEDGSHKGYTRYGHFADENGWYMDWDAAFVNFCLHYAGISGSGLFPDETDTAEWRNRFEEIIDETRGEEENYLTGPGTYEPETGDLVFFVREEEETEEQMGIVSSWEEETNEITVIEGNSGNEVRENTYDAADGQISAYLKLTELEAAYKDILTPKQQQQADAVTALIEALPDPEAVMERFAVLEEAEDEEGCAAYYLELSGQVRAAKEAYEALSEKQKAAVTNAEKLLQYEWLLTDTMEEQGSGDDIPDFAAAVPVTGSGKGNMVLELRYGQDKKRHDELEAQVQSPHWDLIGYFDLYTNNIEGNMEPQDVTVTLHIPKEYIDRESIRFVKIPEGIRHEISEVTENGDNYEISVTFLEYIQTGQMQYEFDLRFLGGIVPADYALKIKATISCGEKSADTAENTYKPSYEKPKVVKYVNTNLYDSMAEDYTRVSASVDKNGMISDSGYVSFWYKIGGDSWFFREYDKITLVDTLPVYEKYVTDGNGNIVTDADGNKLTETATAVFDPKENPGWNLSEDGKTVSRVLETTKSCLNSQEVDGDDKHWRAATDLKNQVEAAELKLRFPGCVIDETANDGFLKKDLENAVEAICHPHNPSAAEKEDILNDTLWFTLTSQPTGAGFAKYNSSNVIMDTQTMRSGLYRWGIMFENSESTEPLSNIVLTDYELDERLKIRTLRLETENKEKYEAINRIEYIEAVKDDGKATKYYPADFGSKKYEYGWGWYQELVLNENEVYKGFIVHMKEGYVLNLGEKIHIGVYTTFREPGKTHYINDGIKDSPANVYHNGASVEYKVQNTFYTITSGNQFSLIQAYENISIEKYLSGNQVEPGTKDKFWIINVKGALADGKGYEDMRIIDLLPEPFQLPKKANGEWDISFGTGDKFVRKSEVKVIENYKNTGRTAVILYLNVDEVRKKLDASDGESKDAVCTFSIKTEVPSNARVGLFTNEAWLLSDDFETVTTQPSAADVHDLDEDGDTSEQIRVAKAGCTIKAPAGVYAEKLIAPADVESWRKNDLFLGVGDLFRYKLCIINTADSAHSGVLVYDVLPRIGDPNISNSGGRGSEYTVNLSGFIEPGEGYQVYYTTSENVYHKSMVEVLGNNSTTEPIAPDSGVIWQTKEEIEKGELLAKVTAFKIVADEGTQIPSKGRAEFVIPVKVADVLENSSYVILDEKQSADRGSGTATYLISTNSFGYRVATFSGSNLESNYVRAQIPFAGFVIKKADAGETDKGLAGAEFRLEKQQSADAGGSEAESWMPVTGYENVTTGSDGTLSFKNLTEGTYRLTETKAPAGYHLDSTPIPVTITLNRETMEYGITIEGNTHAGNSRDPFVIVNHAVYELPSTGGTGAESYALAGTVLMMAAVGLLYRRKGRAEIG